MDGTQHNMRTKREDPRAVVYPKAWPVTPGAASDKVVAEAAGVSLWTVRRFRATAKVPAHVAVAPPAPVPPSPPVSWWMDKYVDDGGGFTVGPIHVGKNKERGSWQAQLRRRDGRRSTVWSGLGDRRDVYEAVANRLALIDIGWWVKSRAAMASLWRLESAVKSGAPAPGSARDYEVARMASVAQAYVISYRKRLGIPVYVCTPEEHKRLSWHKTPEQETLEAYLDTGALGLGIVRDVEIAEAVGVSAHVVMRYRNRLGIPPATPLQRQPATVYAVACLTNNAVKIGIATGFKKRMQRMQRDNPMPLSVLHLIPASPARACERALHLALAKHNIQGEWFHMSPEVLALLEWCSTQRDLTPEAIATRSANPKRTP